MKNIILALGGMMMISACESVPDNSKANEIKFIDPANMDTTVAPGDNFFEYANGAWLKANPVPASETRWGSFNLLIESNYQKLHDLLKTAAAAKASQGSKEQMVGDFFTSGMDSMQAQKLGTQPLASLYSKIDSCQSSLEVLYAIADLQTIGSGSLYNMWIGPDDKNVTKIMVQLAQGGLGMPDRDYYFSNDERSANIREAYKKHIIKLLTLDGMETAKAEKVGADIFEFEKNLAAASMTRVERRDPNAQYNKYAVSELKNLSSSIDWITFFRAMKINTDTVLVGQPKFFKEVGQLVNSASADVWKSYAKFHILNDYSPFLSNDFVNASFDFYGKTVRGQKEQKPRWKRVLNVIDGSVGELLGQLYVDKHFTPEAKENMLELVNNLQSTFASRIKNLEWMENSTKDKALAKLNTFMKKIGYTDKWRDYAPATVSKDNYVHNILELNAVNYQHEVNKLGQPVDKTEWMMTPQTVNAYYNPSFNEIVFPAGILQFPFYDPHADDAINYGGIGAVIGHEMTHGFDDQGRQYDANGNLNNWWSKDDAEKFNAKVKVVEEQFNNYKVLDTVAVNGKLTLGENLADLGGMAIAYEAFQKTEQAKKGEKIDGFTPDQRFFLSWAQIWRANTRPEELAARIVTDPHSPSLWRCNGPLSNFTPFYTAFNVQPGQKMYLPEGQRAKVW